MSELRGEDPAVVTEIDPEVEVTFEMTEVDRALERIWGSVIDAIAAERPRLREALVRGIRVRRKKPMQYTVTLDNGNG